MLGHVQGTPIWADDHVQRQDWQCWIIGQDTDSTLEGSWTEIGAERGYVNI